MSAPSPRGPDSTLANVIAIGATSFLAGIGAQAALLLATFFVNIEAVEFRIAIAIAGVVVAAPAAWIQARRQIARGHLSAAASPLAIAACAASAFALAAIGGPVLYALAGSPRRQSEEGYSMYLALVLLPFAIWWSLRLRPGSAKDGAAPVGAPGAGVAVGGDPFTCPLRPEQREVVAQALADLDAIDAQVSGLHAYRSDLLALGEHAAAAYPAITACQSRFKPLLPDADAKFRPPGAAAPLPPFHQAPSALEHACACYRDAVMIPMLLSDADPGALEYMRSVAARLGAVGDTPEQIADAAVFEARRQRNLAADAAGFPNSHG